MKSFSTLFLVCVFSFSFTQTNQKQREGIKGYIGISEGYRMAYLVNSSLMVGISVPINRRNLIIYGQYQLEGNIGRKDEQSYNKTGRIKSYVMQNHLLGLGLRFRFRPKEKIYSPILSTSVSTEIYSNYVGGKIYTNGGIYFSGSNPSEYYFAPTNKPAGYYSTNTPGHGKYELKSYYTYYYLGTPFMANLNFENEFRIIENLNIVVGVSYSVRKIRLGYKKWGLTESEPKSIISQNINLTKGRVNWHHYIEFSISFNYTFSFKKKNKIAIKN